MRKPRTLPIPRWVSPRHYSTTLAEVFGHSAFILMAFSYAEDDFLRLRIIAVAGSSAMLVFSYFHPYGRVLWLPFKWNMLFIAINSYRIGKVYANRFFAERLSDELLSIRNEYFAFMDHVEFSKLTRIGHLETFNKGDLLIQQGDGNRFVRLVIS